MRTTAFRGRYWGPPILGNYPMFMYNMCVENINASADILLVEEIWHHHIYPQGGVNHSASCHKHNVT